MRSGQKEVAAWLKSKKATASITMTGMDDEDTAGKTMTSMDDDTAGITVTGAILSFLPAILYMREHAPPIFCPSNRSLYFL